MTSTLIWYARTAAVKSLCRSTKTDNVVRCIPFLVARQPLFESASAQGNYEQVHAGFQARDFYWQFLEADEDGVQGGQD